MPRIPTTSDLPSAIDRVEDFLTPSFRRLAVFLDYDGTLTPIVPHPEDAHLSTRMRDILRRLARHCTVAVVSGRDLADVRQRVQLEQLIYAGSHGFDIFGPSGLHLENPEARQHEPALSQAEAKLRNQTAALPGSQIERKKFSIAIHVRNVATPDLPKVESMVDAVAAEHPGLRKSHGKKVFELQPDIDWHKGHAVLWLLQTLKLNDSDLLPLYLGDDLTDEDAFQALQGRGVGIVVRDEPRPTAASYALANTAEVGVFLELLARRSAPPDS
jgi:trehalose-phosphatase